MKVAVIGGDGQLGRDVVRAFTANGDEVRALAHADIELTNSDSISSRLHEARPELIVNTAAMHHVEACEQHPERAFATNALGVRNLARVACDVGAVLIHISTNYVFDGAKGSPYVEEDATLPLNVYGNSKLSGEFFIRSTHPKHFVLRTSGLYGKHPCRAKGGLNFVELMRKLARERGEVRVVDNEFVSPTSTAELAEQIVRLSRSESYGLYHATAEGSCSWYEFAHAIFTITGTKVNLKIAGANEFPAKVLRPRYSVLENRALKARGLNTLKPWRDALVDYLGGSPTAESARV